MRVQVSAYKPEDLTEMVANATGQRSLSWHDRRRVEAQWGGDLVRGFTVRDLEGRVLFCGGMMERHPQYASLWAIYADGLTRKEWGWALTIARNFVAELPHRRVDAMVEADAAMAVRWAQGCGLIAECLLDQAAPGGGDMLVMRRIEP